MSIDEHDERSIRCRMLGHEVTFKYCREVSSGLPCRKILDCWFEKLPVEDFLHQNYTQEQIDQFLKPPPPKLTSLVELIRQAQKNNQTNG